MRPAVLLLVSALLLAASAAPKHLEEHERHRIEELAQTYFQRRADKVTNVGQVAGFGVPTTEPLAARLRIDEAKLEGRRARYSSYPYGGFSRANTRTTLKRLNVAEDGSVVVHVREVTELFSVPSATKYVNKSTFAMTHVLIFNRTTTGWVLAAATRPPGSVCGYPPETEFCGHWSER